MRSSGSGLTAGIQALGAADLQSLPDVALAAELVSLHQEMNRLEGRDLPETGGERPHITVTVDLATLEARVPARAAEVEWIGPICGEVARRLACDAGVTRVITDGPSEILDVGRRTRTVLPAVRRAVVVRDGGSVFPGCDRPPPWCDAHHIVHWADGGPTSLVNLALICRQHHRRLHEGRWQLTRGPDQQVRACPPAA